MDEITRGLARNHGKLCRAPGCHMPRHRISSWCQKHDQRVSLYGHPEGRVLFQRDYLQESTDVAQFLDKHLSHAGVQQALKWWQEWLDAAASGNEEAVAAKDISRLAEKQVSPLDILKAISAVWLYSHRYPRRLPDDERLSYQLSIATLKTCPRYSYISPKGNTWPIRYSSRGKRLIGKRIRATLGLLLVNIASTIDALPDTRQQLKHYLALPFNISPTLLLNSGIPDPITYIPAPLD